MTILGAVKLLLVLFGATVFLIRQSTTLSELVGRLLMASLGPILIVILATTLGVADLVRQLLLQRAPESPLLWLLACLAASVLAYFGLRGLVRFLGSRHTIRVEVWFLFIASGLTSAILPAVYYVFSAVPDTNAYLASFALYRRPDRGRLLHCRFLAECDSPKRPPPSWRAAIGSRQEYIQSVR